MLPDDRSPPGAKIAAKCAQKLAVHGDEVDEGALLASPIVVSRTCLKFRLGAMQNELRSAFETLRVYHDVSVTALAERLGWPENHIVSLEQGTRKITLEDVQCYADAFEIPASSLLLLAEQSAGVFTRDAGAYVADKVVVIIEWLTSINALKWKELTASRPRADCDGVV